ncbi:MAG: 1-acyl-sn-glycerol-3-phosphate acyltransferase [Parcubacteria group bacterium]|nr:1-acyl-sn-glycerol-3-phosphate acyltransferase [Parcubacteria group bacterium]MBI2048952.1 1-acyl-sn-glycerol-3-phosphate acyltransferase [Parcubacteria group bacterium]
MSLLGIRHPALLRVTKAIQLFIYYAGKLFFFRARIEVRGAEHISRLHGNAVFASNHSSEFDPVILCLALEKAHIFRTRLPVIFLSREKEFYSDMGFMKAMLYGGMLFHLLGAYPVTPKKERVNPRVRQNTIATHISLLKEGLSVFIFPEGTITQTGEPTAGKPGVAILSEQSERPIVPIAIQGAFGLSFADFLFGRKSVRVTFGEPMYPPHGMRDDSGFLSKKSDYRETARFVMRYIKNLLQESDAKK